MVELIIVIVAVVLLYGLAKKFIKVQNDKASIWVAEQSLEMQDDLKQLSDRVDAVKASNNNKWITIESIESKMQ